MRLGEDEFVNLDFSMMLVRYTPVYRTSVQQKADGLRTLSLTQACMVWCKLRNSKAGCAAAWLSNHVLPVLRNETDSFSITQKPNKARNLR